MNQIKSIFKNTSWMTLSQFVTSICAFLWTILIARYLGVSDYGILSFAISFTAITGIFMDLGMTTFTTRELSRDKNLSHKYINNIFPIKLLVSILIIIATSIILYILKYDFLTIEVTLILTIELIFMSMTSFINGVFQSFEKLKYQAIGTIMNSGLLLITILITMHFNLGLIAVAIAYTISYSIFLIYMFIKLIQKFGLVKFEFDKDFWKNTIIKSAPFGLTAFFYTIYFSIDVVMLSYISGDYVTGIYNSAYKIITVFTTFYVVYQFVIFPVMSKFFKESDDLLRISYEQSIKYLLIIILPITIGVSIYSEYIVNLIYSSQYALASEPVEILIWTVSFLFINGAASLLLNSINKEKVVTKIYIIAAVFNVILNFILIPKYTYIGASIATVLSEILICIVMIHIIRKSKYCPNKSFLKVIAKIIISTLVLAIVLEYMNVSIWLAIPIGLVVYGLAILLTRTLDDSDKYIIKEILGKNN